jgi:hypothetical protein
MDTKIIEAIVKSLLKRGLITNAEKEKIINKFA